LAVPQGLHHSGQGIGDILYMLIATINDRGSIKQFLEQVDIDVFLLAINSLQ
jgi:hypothetical protein